ncbi:MAG: chitobiase/beta-hexosaminidase C-terminal domain-containing protein [Lachnospiraceae bacterium]|nr:chitobiase/beta-hexosaminidase C-terminal domain-containing protein [Lachnospiraceae bacterium]
MKCMYCGADIDDGLLYCANCGKEVQIVPDYSPLDEVLAAQVKGAINGGTFTLPLDKFKENYSDESNSSTRKQRSSRQNSQRTGGQRLTSRDMPRDNERKRAQTEKRKKQQKKKRIITILILASILLIIGIISFFSYQNSYNGQVKKGYNALENKQYEKAIAYYENAISKDKQRSEAYAGLAKVYVAEEDLEKAEAILLDAIENYSSEKLYKATIDFYIDTNQLSKISVLLDGCEDDTILKSLNQYQSEGPIFSLEEGTYDDVQEVTLTSKGKAIYYTLDGSEPTIASTKYAEPIQLSEGVTTIRTIAVNSKNVPSLEVKKAYTVELPIEDAPAVTPSTGQYEQAMQIKITVPDGYEAYYTLDGSIPTTESMKYTGSIDMPEGNTLFCAVLVNTKGKMSDITKKNYDLTMDN